MDQRASSGLGTVFVGALLADKSPMRWMCPGCVWQVWNGLERVQLRVAGLYGYSLITWCRVDACTYSRLFERNNSIGALCTGSNEMLVLFLSAVDIQDVNCKGSKDQKRDVFAKPINMVVPLLLGSPGSIVELTFRRCDD